MQLKEVFSNHQIIKLLTFIKFAYLDPYGFAYWIPFVISLVMFVASV